MPNYQLCRSREWFHPTCSVHAEILSDNKEYPYLNTKMMRYDKEEKLF
jgi:hypothetical protein